MIVVLPVEPSIPDQQFETNLDGTNYAIRVRWNSRMEQWFMDVMDETESPIAMGLALVLGAYIGKRCADPRFPPGLFMASDLANSGTDATLDDITTRVPIYYYSADELA